MMKKWIFMCLLATAATNSFAIGNIYYDLGCPRTSVDNTSGRHTLYRDGLVVSGYGMAYINGVEQPDPLMKGILPLRAPKDIAKGGYVRAGAFYNSFTGIAGCHYESSLGYPSFDVFFKIDNGRHGVVKYARYDAIRIMFSLG